MLVIRLSSFIVGFVFLTGCAPTSAEYQNSGSPSLQFELRRASSDAVEGWDTLVFHPSGASVAETLSISPTAEISNSNLRSTSVKQDATGTWMVVLTLNESAKLRFGELSAKMAGETAKRERLAFMIDGKTLVAPFVTAPMTDGVISMTGPFTEDEARRIAKGIMGP